MRTFIAAWCNFSEGTRGVDLIRASGIRSLLEQIGFLEHKSSYDDHEETALELQELFDEENGHDYNPLYTIKELITKQDQPTLIKVKGLKG